VPRFDHCTALGPLAVVKQFEHCIRPLYAAYDRRTRVGEAAPSKIGVCTLRCVRPVGESIPARPARHYHVATSKRSLSLSLCLHQQPHPSATGLFISVVRQHVSSSVDSQWPPAVRVWALASQCDGTGAAGMHAPGMT